MAADPALLNAVTWKIPNALALVGSRAGEEWNAMTTSWITQVSMEPVLVGIGVDNTAVTHRLISAAARSPSICGPPTTPRCSSSSPSRRCSRADGATTTLNGRVVHAAPSGAPVFAEAIAWMDCEVRQAIDFGTHTFFVGEITAAAVNDDEARAAAMSDTRMKYGGVKRH